MKRYIVLIVGCLVFVSVAAGWLLNVREVGQDWRPSREPVARPIPSPTADEVANAGRICPATAGLTKAPASTQTAK